MTPLQTTLRSGPNKPLLFFGNERLATGLGTSAPILRGLIAAGYTIAAVIVAQKELASSRKVRELEVETVAHEHNIPILVFDRLDDDAAAQLKSYDVDVAVLAAYGKIVPQAILDLFPTGIINIHPSLLPLHRGSTPIESVILEGAKETGVTLIRLAAEMDAGPIYAQDTILLNGTETKEALSAQLMELGAQLLLAHLPAILDGSLEPEPQDDTRVTTDKQINKDAALLDWQKPTVQLEREVRAYAGWPRSKTMIGTEQVIITEAHIGEGDGVPGTLWLGGKQIGMHAADGVLVFDMLIPAGRKAMPASAFLASFKP